MSVNKHESLIKPTFVLHFEKWELQKNLSIDLNFVTTPMRIGEMKCFVRSNLENVKVRSLYNHRTLSYPSYDMCWKSPLLALCLGCLDAYLF